MISRDGLSEEEWQKLLYSTPVEEHNQWNIDLYEDYLKYPDYNSGLHLMNVEDVEKVVWWAVAGFRWKLDDWRAYIADMDEDQLESFEELGPQDGGHDREVGGGRTQAQRRLVGDDRGGRSRD